jgi:hypothetical protein
MQLLYLALTTLATNILKKEIMPESIYCTIIYRVPAMCICPGLHKREQRNLGVSKMELKFSLSDKNYLKISS